MHIYFTYMMEGSDGTLYVGVTNNVARRFKEHSESNDTRSYTFRRRPLKLVHVETFQWIQASIAREKQITGWSAPKKRALALGQEETAYLLARCRNGTVHDRPERDLTIA